MLSLRAKEAGYIEFRNVMELPIVYGSRASRRSFSLCLLDKHLQLTPGFGEGNGDPYSDYRLNITLDRLKLVAAGPSAWKLERIGDRDCSVETIMERLQTLSSGGQEQAILLRKSATLLDKDNVAELHISTLQHCLLQRVLADFSFTEWRILAGQIFWELAPHHDGDCLEDSPEGTNLDTAPERKWLLILQIILSAEVLFRADAATKIETHS
ncbi:hypothetical protein ACJ72_02556 [Emergomyces africanus]|uniref:Uncharacterized protein n=1 Tax=Emergomyces africanus TaxID=1955775 RepID=A0A1B7P231_9EURO|nr:hypothetical protein ACJ72_02556 [Emergomyces africanus]